MLALSLPEGFSGIELSVFFEVSATTARGGISNGASDSSGDSRVRDDSLDESGGDDTLKDASIVLILMLRLEVIGERREMSERELSSGHADHQRRKDECQMHFTIMEIRERGSKWTINGK